MYIYIEYDEEKHSSIAALSNIEYINTRIGCKRLVVLGGVLWFVVVSECVCVTVFSTR